MDVEDKCVCGHSESNHDWMPSPPPDQNACIGGRCRVTDCPCQEFESKYDEHDDLEK